MKYIILLLLASCANQVAHYTDGVDGSVPESTVPVGITVCTECDGGWAGEPSVHKDASIE